MDIVQHSDGSVKTPPLSPIPPFTPPNQQTQQAKEQAKDKRRLARMEEGSTLHKFLLKSCRETLDMTNMTQDYKRAIVGMIARKSVGKLVDVEKVVEQISSMDIAGRAQRESKTDLCRYIERVLFPPEPKLCSRCGRAASGFIEGMCFRCYMEVT